MDSEQPQLSNKPSYVFLCNPSFPTSHHMCFYDNLWQSNYKVNENILHKYKICSCPLILGRCLYVCIYSIHQDIHIQSFLVVKATCWLQTSQVLKLSELVWLICTSLYTLTPIRTGYILVLFFCFGLHTISVNLTILAVKFFSQESISYMGGLRDEEKHCFV